MTAQSYAWLQRKHLGILCYFAIVALLIATMWPFDFFPPNRVSWLPETNGIRFGVNGVVVSQAPLPSAGTQSGDSCSLELLLRPPSVESVHTILAFYVPDNQEQFRVRQWTDGLLVSRDFVDPMRRIQMVHFDVDHAFRQGRLLLLTITSGPQGTVVYSDGRRTQAFPNFHIAQSDLAGLLVLGGSAVNFEPWPGEIRGLAIYSRELTPQDALQHYLGWTDERPDERAGEKNNGGAGKSPDLDGATARYNFAERSGREIHNQVASGPALEIPKWFGVPRKHFLDSVANEYEPDWDYVKHVLENVVGFIPLGLIVCAYLSWPPSKPRAILYTILAAGILSCAIEMLQVFIPERTSDQTDIIANTLGAALGAVLGRLCVAYRSKFVAGRHTD